MQVCVCTRDHVCKGSTCVCEGPCMRGCVHEGPCVQGTVCLGDTCVCEGSTSVCVRAACVCVRAACVCVRAVHVFVCEGGTCVREGNVWEGKGWGQFPLTNMVLTVFVIAQWVPSCRGPAMPPPGQQASWAQSAARLRHAAPNPGSVSPLDVLLDDVILTHSLFLPTERLLQQLHQRFLLASGSPSPGWEESDALPRKRAVLTVLLHFLETYKGLLQEEESAGKVIKDLYLLIMKDTSLYPELEDEILRLHQLVETVELKVPEETPPPSKQVKPLFRHFRRIDSCLQTRVAFRGSDEIFCRVYMPDHSYVTIRSRLSASVQDILAAVTEKLQYSEEQSARGEALALVVVASSGEKALLQPNEDCVFTTLGINSHLFACTKDAIESLVPLPEEIQISPGDTEFHRVEAEEIANHMTAFHWELFRCVHELEFVDYVFHGERGRRETANLELLLQRCSEVQHWVATEILLCESLGKRAHLLKKLIKIAAICKQNQDMLSFYAMVMGLDNAAVSRLRLTWEKLPGKFKNLFRKFETLTDPCRNHKTYREVLSKMNPPLIPFVPLILKDLTFVHEGSKTLLDGLVNVEKLHSIAEKVRTIRKYRSRPLSLDLEASPSQLQTKAYVRQLQVIDNQNLLFELSYKLEASSQ
ncbi:rap guanine nucleotide exchange factor-like 1 isoform X1 [Gopherus flavomarginatus]|uniref:rap guanine nucleotide exchange factor-like 1 isoform X1 n=1 Tax=Gopherus flavomarginatus TaxID=286002 RepID=UPI0021CC1DF3|nr:rap guanine nucleotide exchange factor-like 1 isoform X1 [Gopherus flavomarginatus]